MLIKVYSQYSLSNGVLVTNHLATFNDIDIFENCKEGFYKDILNEEIIVRYIDFDYEHIKEILSADYLEYQIDTLRLRKFAEDNTPDDEGDFIFKFKSMVKGLGWGRSIVKEYL
jgi:hypothetical protein